MDCLYLPTETLLKVFGDYLYTLDQTAFPPSRRGEFAEWIREHGDYASWLDIYKAWKTIFYGSHSSTSFHLRNVQGRLNASVVDQ